MIGNITAGLYGVGVPPSTNSYESIATSLVGAGGATSIDFNLSGVSGYKHLQIRYIARGSILTNSLIQFNSDTGSNYSWHVLYGTGASALAAGGGTNSFMYASNIASATSNFTGGVIDILDYASTSKYKTMRTLGGYDANGSGEIGLFSGSWQSNSAVTSIKLYPNSSGTYSQYSEFALYGIKD
jgi:hypothetical protein